MEWLMVNDQLPLPMPKQYKFVIDGKLIGYNEYGNQQRTNYYKANKTKRSIQDDLRRQILAQVKLPIRTIKTQVNVHCHWIEPNKKRDKDNISSAIKFILDTLVHMRLLKNDGWQQIGDIKHTFVHNTQSNGGVIVILDTIE